MNKLNKFLKQLFFENEALNRLTINFYKSAVTLPLSVILLSTLILFQNCSGVLQQLPDIRVNPNRSPLSSNSGDSQQLIAPNTVKNKLINGIEVQGFDEGSWVYVFVDDQCVKNRKDIIDNSPLYFLDPYLKAQFNFAAPVGVFNVSMVSIQLQNFISKQAFEDALSLDKCAAASYVTSSSPLTALAAANQTVSGNSSTWPLMGLDESTLQQLSAFSGTQKVNVGVSALGFNLATTPPLPLSPNAVGIVSGDPDGMGTFLSSLIALPKSAANSVQGVADGIAELIPVAMPLDYQEWMFHKLVFNQIKQMVNRGSEVVVLPLWRAATDFCDPLIGQALYYAIERRTTVVVPAGSIAGGAINDTAGEIVGPRDYSLFQQSKTAQVSCWGRYFRGVITVGSRTQSSTAEIASFSNYGAEGVEILAPGQSVLGLNKDSQVALASNTEASSALVGGAIAHIIGFYKSKGWFYSPWLIEDTLMNGSATGDHLPDSGLTVRRKKLLNFSALKNFIAQLASGTEENARLQATDNPEADQSINLSSLQPNERPIKLDVFSKNFMVYTKDRNQFQAVFYYVSGAAQVVTERVIWSSSDATNFPVDNQGIVRPKTSGTFTITARDSTTGLSGSYTAQAVDVDTISGESGKIVRLELRERWETSQTKYFERISSDNYKLLFPFLAASIWAVYDNGISRLVTDYTTYTVFYNNSVLAADFIRNRSGAGSLVHFGFFRGGQNHELILFYRGFQQRINILMPAYSFVGWKWPSNVFSDYYNKVIQSHTETTMNLYNVGQWYHVQYKVPICLIEGVEMSCPPNVVDSSLTSCTNGPCGYQPTTTLPTSGLNSIGSGTGSLVPLGQYKVDQKYTFYGNNSDTPLVSSISVNVVDAPKIKVLKHAAWNFSINQTNVSSPDSSEGTVQLAPVCSGLQGIVYQQNASLGIDEFHRLQSFDSQVQVSFKDSAGNPFTQFVADPSRYGILITGAVNGPKMNVKVSDVPAAVEIIGPTRIVTDAFDSDLNWAAKTWGNGYVTPRTLPALPAEPAIDPVCSQPLNSVGAHAGDGKENNPYIVCTWVELKNLVASLPENVLGTTYVALGASLDLTGMQKPHIDLRGLADLNGRGYAIKNAVSVDTENSVLLMSRSMRIHDLILKNNQLIGKYAYPFFMGSFWNIYSYDNHFEGQVVAGVAESALYARNIFTKNLIRYSSTGNGMFSRTMTTVLESFASDDARYTGIVGNGTYLGIGQAAAASGSNSKITGGAVIGGVANHFCYRCYSAVEINSTNHRVIGGILIYARRIGNIEIGESEANIVVAGTGYAGGLIGSIDNESYVSGYYDSQTPNNGSSSPKYIKFGHTHIIKSKFKGTLSGTGHLGAVVGFDSSSNDTYFSDSDFTGTVNGAGKKGSLVGKASGQCISSVKKQFKKRNVLLNTEIPVVGENNDGVSQPSGTDF